MEQDLKDKNSFDNAGKKGEKNRGSSARERTRSQSKSRQKRSASYSGSFDLVDSFEAEENRSKKKSGKASGKAQKTYETKDAVENRAVKGKKSRTENRAENRGKASGDAVGNKNTAGQNKNKKAKGYKGHGDSYRDDASIKTKAGNKYIPFETYDDDDIIPAEDMYFEPEKRDRGQVGRKSNAKGYDEAAPGAVVGRNAVRELLRSDRSVDKIYVKSGDREGSIVVIVAEAVSRKIPIVEVSGEKLDALSGGASHQGVVALAAEKQYTDIDSILKIAKDRGEKPLVIIADGIEDPQNLGALIRCAECAGAHGVIIPKRRAVGLTPVVTKASAGAVEHMAIAKVTNLADAVEKLKKAGLWIFAAEAGGIPYYEADFNVPCAVILGSEGFGVSRLLKEKSDFTVSIPMYGRVNSLNVSTAAAVILCHAARMQRVGK